MKTKLKVLWKRLSTKEYNVRYSRLAGEIECYKPVLENRIAISYSQEAEWAKQAKVLIARSEKFLSEFKIDEAWKAFHTAKRLEIMAMTDEERLTLADELRMEVAKLNVWRKEAVLEIIGRNRAEFPRPPAAMALMRAVELKDEHYNNQYYKNQLSQNLFSLLFGLILIWIALIFIFLYFLMTKYEVDLSKSLNNWEYFVGVLLFGFLGATTSAILFTRYLSRYSRITEIGSSRVITLSKIFVGAAFSVFIFMVLKSSIAENIQIFAFKINEPLDYFVVAFVSGFSERLAQKAIESIVGKEKDEEKPAATAEKHEA